MRRVNWGHKRWRGMFNVFSLSLYFDKTVGIGLSIGPHSW